MADDSALRERLARLEAQNEAQTARLTKIESDMGELLAIMHQAKGARWIVLLMASVGGFIATYGAKIIGVLPR